MLCKRLNGGSQVKELLVICLILSFSGSVFSADVILNEYNAVSASMFLGGGNASSDLQGGRASDPYFGRVLGNGGDWFELVVITDHLDMRNWYFDIYNDGSFIVILGLTNDIIWSDLRRGTIITVSENLPSDISYDPGENDWWIHVQAGVTGDGLYIAPLNFPVSSNDWQLRIRNSDGEGVFGHVGEGVWPVSGVSDIEIFRLEADPCSTDPCDLITADSEHYDDGKDFSTFGSPNQWGRQDFNTLRSVVFTPPAFLNVTKPTPNPDSSPEIIKGGSTFEITWHVISGTVDSVDIEYSIDGGKIWSDVYPPNVGNTGSYNWLVPDINTELGMVRVTKTNNNAVHDTSNGVFFIYQCPLEGDLTDDCIIDLADVSVMASAWLGCGDPYNPGCL